MTARLLEGRPVADAIWREVEQRASAFSSARGRPPTVGVMSGPEANAQAYAIMQPEEYDELKRKGVTMVELGRDPRRVVVARR